MTKLNLSDSNSFSFIIPYNYSLGNSNIEFRYIENNFYFSSIITQELFIISSPTLQNIYINNTSTSSGEPVLISGNLVDETNSGVIATIDIIKKLNDAESTLTQVSTNKDGYFEFIYIAEDSDLGIYELKVNYAGDGLYYLPISVVISLFQNNEFYFSIEGHNAGGIANISVIGDSYGQFSISYADSLDSTNWFVLAEFYLDEYGQLNASILLPDVFGPFILKVYDINNNRTSYYEHYTFKIPSYRITFLNDPFTFSDTDIMINSSVKYRLL
ncbi:MAG: hypothetical protein ACC656_12015, partial [Candidatus Heimdallarchaeota archaeon]